MNYSKKIINTMIPWSRQNFIKQIRINSADGSYIYSDNKKIIDFTSGAMAVNLGHNNKYVLEGFNLHKNTGISYIPSNFSTYQRDKLSSRIIDITHGSGKVLFTNAGADANEGAMFIAKEFSYLNNHNKTKILSFKKSFHGGSTIGASLISGDNRLDNKDRYYKLTLDPIMENPEMNDNGNSSLKQIETLFKNDSICSILIEGSSGSAGCILYPDGYLKKLEGLCKKYNVLIICDEVMSGWGRTGKMFAYQNHDINPDIITTAKAITSGYSQLGAVIVNDNISSIFNDNPIMYGLTYSGHILPCTIANRCLDLYLDEDLKIIDNVDQKSDLIRNICEKIKIKHELIYDFRNNGLLGCFEINTHDEKILSNISEKLLDNNIYCLRIRNNIFLAPPLTINEDLIETTLNKIDNIFTNNKFI
jgi:taurine---2-oxoglutarate transaminase